MKPPKRMLPIMNTDNYFESKAHNKCMEDWEKWINNAPIANAIKKMGSVKIPIHKVNGKLYYCLNPEDIEIMVRKMLKGEK